MPELPEVEATKLGIEPYILNQKVEGVIVRNPHLRWEVTPELKTELIGLKLRAVRRRGKYLFLETKKGTVLIHLGMSGKLRIWKNLPYPQAGKHDHVDFIFKNKVCLRLTDPRRFGCVLWIVDELNHPLLKNMGPEPLEKEFTSKYLFQKTRHKKVAIKIFLMNGKNVVGIGNIYALEALFLAKIHPQRAAQSLTLAESKILVNAIKKVLLKAVKKGGTTLRDYAQTSGDPGNFVQQLNVYGRGGLPCKVCHTQLKEIKQAQRTTVFCPKCQKI